jgi:T5SS/PEP-CTERM-associated repeat protein
MKFCASGSFSETISSGFLTLIWVKTIYYPSSEGLALGELSLGIWHCLRIVPACIGFALLQAPRMDAEVVDFHFSGSVGAIKSLVSHEPVGGGELTTELCRCFFPSTANFVFPVQTSASIKCGDCASIGAAGQTVASVSGTASGTLSGSASPNQTMTFTASGNAHVFVTPNSPEGGSGPQADFNATADVRASIAGGFNVVGKAETIIISRSISGSGFGIGTVTLSGSSFGGGFTRRSYVIDLQSGSVLNDTLPESLSLSLPPGGYGVSLDVLSHTNITSSVSSPPLDAKFEVTLSVTVLGPSSELHWKNAAGGNFGDAPNWNPQKVPDLATTAILDLPEGNVSPVSIQAANDAVGQLFIRGMPVHFTGPLKVLAANPAQFGFVVEDGGSLVLDSGAIFGTGNASIGSGGAESSILVSGASTKWTSASLAPVVIGPTGRGRVVVEHDATLNAQKKIIVGGLGGLGAGTLRIESGGQVTTPDFTMNNGSLEVRGSSVKSSDLRIEHVLDIGGENGTGNVVLEHGATVTAERILVGDRAGNSGESVTISGNAATGASSILTVKGPSGFLQVAGGGGTQIEVKDGGGLFVPLGGQAQIGHLFEVGKVLVHGKAGSHLSSWLMNGELFIGSQIVFSELEIADGALVGVNNLGQGRMVLGLKAGELGRATVSGAGTVLDTDVLTVGNNGSGELRVTGGARVQSDRAAVGLKFVADGGVGSGNVSIEAGVLTSTEWHVSGNCVVGFDEFGKIELHGLNIGPIGAKAKLTVDDTLTVGPHGFITGHGTLTTGHLINNGMISPGFSPGTIEINGNYEQTVDGALHIEVAGIDAGQFDLVQINGDATLAGRVELAFIQGFVPKAGDTVEFLKVTGNVSGALDIVPLVVPADLVASRPAMAVQAKWSITTDGKASLTVIEVRPTVQLNVALDSGAGGKVNLSFVPVAGSNHFVEFRDGLAAGSAWQRFPGAPHNSGIVSDRPATDVRFYRVRIEN